MPAPQGGRQHVYRLRRGDELARRLCASRIARMQPVEQVGHFTAWRHRARRAGHTIPAAGGSAQRQARRRHARLLQQAVHRAAHGGIGQQRLRHGQRQHQVQREAFRAPHAQRGQRVAHHVQHEQFPRRPAVQGGCDGARRSQAAVLAAPAYFGLHAGDAAVARRHMRVAPQFELAELERITNQISPPQCRSAVGRDGSSSTCSCWHCRCRRRHSSACRCGSAGARRR